MKRLKVFGLCFVLYALVLSCNNCDFSERKVEITNEYIKSNCVIKSFQLALSEDTEINSEGYPVNYKEKERYCCSFGGDALKKVIYFHRINDGYKWICCTLDLRFVEVDSLKDLSIEEKNKIIGDDEPIIQYDTLPLKFEHGKTYCLFNIDNYDGSYYLYFDKNMKFVAKYFNGGPF